MTLNNRAAQFAPFSALTGLDGEMEETARLTDMDAELTEDKISELNQLICQAMEEDCAITVTFFVPDEKKQGGSFKSVTGHIKKADPIEGLLLRNGIALPMYAIRKIAIADE